MAPELQANSPEHNLPDHRRVALIKSQATYNRFYCLVTPESGIRNADFIESIPFELHLGIAYPCLEDGLNDFAVIRTTYETLEFFPDDLETRTELMEIIADARAKLVRRLTELQERIAAKRAHFLGTDLNEFKSYAWDIVHRGYPRRNLDNMMKLNVFGSVSKAEGHEDGSEPLYFFEFRNNMDMSWLSKQPPREFIALMFGDVLDSVRDDANYQSQYTFDKFVFQKFIAMMFVNYATTDPMFYGTNRSDYGVSAEKDMDETPLYRAVADELRKIEIEIAEEEGVSPAYAAATGTVAPETPFESTSRLEGMTVQLPGELINEDVLLGPIASICAVADQLAKRNEHDLGEFSKFIIAEASRLVRELKRLKIVSEMANDPGERRE